MKRYSCDVDCELATFVSVLVRARLCDCHTATMVQARTNNSNKQHPSGSMGLGRLDLDLCVNMTNESSLGRAGVWTGTQQSCYL